VEELKTAIANRDKAAVQSQAGFSSTLANIRNEHERAKGVYEDRIRKTQAQCKQLQVRHFPALSGTFGAFWPLLSSFYAACVYTRRVFFSLRRLTATPVSC